MRCLSFYRTPFYVLQCASFYILFLGPSARTFGQEQYELTTGQSSVASTAEVSPLELLIRDGSQRTTRYTRERRFDTSDGRWIGYLSSEARQAVRWPSDGRGRMQIGSIAANGTVSFRESQMTIRSAGTVIDRDRNINRDRAIDRDRLDGATLPPVDALNVPRPPSPAGNSLNQPLPIQLVNSQNNVSRYLGRLQNGGLGVYSQSSGVMIDWQLVPVGNGLVRLQHRQGNQWRALGCNPQTRGLNTFPISGNAGQLWRLNPTPGLNKQFVLENMLFPGQALTWQAGGVALQAINFAASQQWSPVFQPVGPIDSFFRTVSHQIVPNPPLPAAQVDLVNRHKETIWVLLADRRDGATVERYRIPSGGIEQVTLDRDSGATIVETYELQSSAGVWDRQEFSTAVPPAPFYDVSVYEEFLQSIAIDRTGKSPNSIEDINYQPRSIGWFLVLPGDRLPERSELDCYSAAAAARNPGAVRRLDPKLFDKSAPAVDPLKQLLEEIQSRRGAF